MKYLPNTHRAIRRRGYTLIELMLSVAAGSVLVGGLSGSLYIAAQSLEVNRGDLAEQRDAHQVLAEINRDAQSALTMTELTATTVTMRVPDRDGDNLPEIIRYAWSGQVGDPLTKQFNGGAAVPVATNVQAFSLDWLSRLIEGVSTLPKVLFVSTESPIGNDGLATPTASEQLRIDLMEGWGYQVTVISDQANQGDFNAQLDDHNCIYVTGEVSDANIGNKINSATQGIVSESLSVGERLGLMDGNYSLSWDTIRVVNNSHYITNQLSAGPIELTTESAEIKIVFDEDLAAGAKRLVDLDFATSYYASLLIVDQAAELIDGEPAAGRRCQLPWGHDNFDMSILTSDAELIMKRAIEWAAGADMVAGSGVVFQGFSEKKRGSNVKSTTIDTPADVAEGDLMIAAISADGSSTITAPAGWTQLSQDTANSTVSLGVWWKIATVSEPSSHTFTWDTNEQAYGWIMRFTGHDPANPIHASADNGGSANNPISPAVTTTLADCLILRIGGFDDDDATVGDTGLTGHSTINMDVSSSGNGQGRVSGGAGYVIQTVAGDSGTANFSYPFEEFLTVTIAIAPDPNN